MRIGDFNRGAVFIGTFAGIDRKKYFVITGISKEKVCFCAFYINSNIPPSIMTKPKLLNLQVNIKGSKYDFLQHDSFVACNTPLEMKTTDLHKCKYVGQFDAEDLANVTETVIKSALLTQNQLELYCL